jgi:AraC family transcriptional regulator
MATTIIDNTLGKHIRCADFQDLRVSESRYAPGAQLHSHAHEFTYLSLVLRGTFEERVGRKAELARSGSVVVMPRGVTHDERFGTLGARSVTVTLKSSFFRETERGEHQLGPWRWFHGGTVARIMLRLYEEHLLEGSAAELGLCERLIQLAEAIGCERDSTAVSTRRCVTAALEFLHERGAVGVRLGELATDLGIDPADLARAFRRQMGCTMSEYRRRLWVREAAHLLASSKASLSEVALRAGFADQSHLCRVFKAEMGVTPKTYRHLAG